MLNGEKKIIRCSSCNTAYNIASLKPGVKFKCHKCGTINTVLEPEPIVPEPELLLLEEEAPAAPKAPAPPAPATRPAARVGKPPSDKPVRPTGPTGLAKPGLARRKGKSSVLAGKMGARYSKLGKGGKTSRFGRRAPEAEEGAEEELPEPKKSKTALIIGIVVGVMAIVVVIILLVTSGKEEPIEPELESTKPSVEEPATSTSPKPKTSEYRTEWKKVDPSLKREIENLLRSLRDAPNMSAAAQIKLDIINKGEDGMAALIEMLLDDPDNLKGFKNLIFWISDLTAKEFRIRPPRRKPYTNAELAERYKNWWLNKTILTPEYKFPPEGLVKNLEKEIKEVSTRPGPGPVALPPISGFEVNETLRSEVFTVLSEIAGYGKNDTEWQDGARKIKDMGKDAIPILILEIANNDIEIGYCASELLLKWTKRTDAPTFTPLVANEKFNVSQDWQQWWLKNKDKF